MRKDFLTPLLDAIKSKRLKQGDWSCCLVTAIYPECELIKDIPAEFLPKRWAGFIVTVFDEISNLIARTARFAQATRNIRHMYGLDFNARFSAEVQKIVGCPEGSYFSLFLTEKEHKFKMANDYSFWRDHQATNVTRTANLIWDSFCTILESYDVEASS